MPGRGRLREIEERLQRAHEQAERAGAQFNEVIADVPSGIPCPDGVARVTQAAAAYQRALRELEDASADLEKLMLGPR
jgi:hypothetical protein